MDWMTKVQASKTYEPIPQKKKSNWLNWTILAKKAPEKKPRSVNHSFSTQGLQQEPSEQARLANLGNNPWIIGRPTSQVNGEMIEKEETSR